MQPSENHHKKAYLRGGVFRENNEIPLLRMERGSVANTRDREEAKLAKEGEGNIPPG